MIYSHYLQSENQSTKWDRVRVNYELVEKLIKHKEALGNNYIPNKIKPLIKRNKNESKLRQCVVHVRYGMRTIRLLFSNMVWQF
jgi:hypothetical protein